LQVKFPIIAPLEQVRGQLTRGIGIKQSIMIEEAAGISGKGHTDPYRKAIGR
jgi:hypothetical protein